MPDLPDREDDPAPAGRRAAPIAQRVYARTLVALLVSIGAGIGVDRIADAVLADGLVAFGVALLTACGVGAALMRLAIAPVTRAREILESRYAEALADALGDPLTGLGNHRAFQEELERQVEHARRYSAPVALVLIDLDDFKSVNDSLGHAAGDRVLGQFGRQVLAALRKVDRSFRTGGDEFAILLPHTDADGARIVAQRMLATALSPHGYRSEGRAISFSAGISALPALASDRTQLYAQADAALYAAKRRGRTDVAIFEPEMEDGVDDHAGAGSAIGDVLARGLLRPVYQPIVDLASGEFLGYEGLIRPVAPAPFAEPASLFAAAESGGHLTALDLACIETLVAGAERLAPDQFLSVNLSPRTLEAPEFTSAALLGILSRHGFAPERLVVELTERQAIEDVNRARIKFESLRRAGVRLAADDIGAGNSGLRLLSELRFDVLKVDLSLVRGSAPGGLSGAVLRTVVELGASIGALVVAEGIEDEAELVQVRAAGTAAGQGYLLGRPGPIGSHLEAVAGADEAAAMIVWRQSVGLPPMGTPSTAS